MGPTASQQAASQPAGRKPHTCTCPVATSGQAGVEKVHGKDGGQGVGASWQRQLSETRAAHAQVVKRDRRHVAARDHQVLVAARGAQAGAAAAAGTLPRKSSGGGSGSVSLRPGQLLRCRLAAAEVQQLQGAVHAARQHLLPARQKLRGEGAEGQNLWGGR